MRRPRSLGLSVLVILALSARAITSAQAPPSNPLSGGYDLLHRGDKTGAEKYFADQAKSRPDDLGARFGVLVAEHARLHGGDEAAVVAFEHHLDRLIDIANTRHSHDSHDTEALFYCAFAHMLRGTYKIEHDKGVYGAARDGAHAKNDIQQYLKLQPDDADADLALGTYNYFASLAPAYANVLRVLLFLPSGDRAEGIKELENAAAHGRLFAVQAQRILVSIYAYEGRPADAAAVGEQLVREFPENDDLELLLGDLYHGASFDDQAKATAAYEHVIARRRDDTSPDGAEARHRALLGLAATRFSMWHCDEAIAALTPTIDERPSTPRWVLPEFLIRRARYRLLLNDPHGSDDAAQVVADGDMTKWHKDAAAVLASMSRRSADEVSTYVALIPANRLVADGQWDAARTAYATFAARVPGDPQVRYRIAYLDFVSGKADQAQPIFSALAGSDAAPAWVRAWSILYNGRSDDLDGRRDAARKAYQTVIDDYQKQDAADAARLGLITPYRRRA